MMDKSQIIILCSSSTTLGQVQTSNNSKSKLTKCSPPPSFPTFNPQLPYLQPKINFIFCILISTPSQEYHVHRSFSPSSPFSNCLFSQWIIEHHDAWTSFFHQSAFFLATLDRQKMLIEKLRQLAKVWFREVPFFWEISTLTGFNSKSSSSFSLQWWTRRIPRTKPNFNCTGCCRELVCFHTMTLYWTWVRQRHWIQGKVTEMRTFRRWRCSATLRRRRRRVSWDYGFG